MTVPTYRSREDYTGNGVTTSYPYQFRIYKATDLVVTRATPDGEETTLVLNTDYTVTGVGKYAGGNVVLTSALASGYRLAIERALPVTQETDLRNQGAYFAETHEDVFDRAVMILQRIAGYLGLGPDGAIRTLLLGKTDVDGQGAYRARQNRIQDLADPMAQQDAANKRWTTQLLADSLTDGDGNAVLQLLASSDPDKGSAKVYGVGRVVASIAALKVLPKTGSQNVFVTGYYSAGDGGGGAYCYDPSDTTSVDNGGTIIVATDGGRWKLVVTGTVSVKQFGAYGDGVHDDTAAIQNAITYCISAAVKTLASGGALKLRVDKGVYLVSSTLNLSSVIGFWIAGDGQESSIIVFTGSASRLFYYGIYLRCKISDITLAAGSVAFPGGVATYSMQATPDNYAIQFSGIGGGTDFTEANVRYIGWARVYDTSISTINVDNHRHWGCIYYNNLCIWYNTNTQAVVWSFIDCQAMFNDKSFVNPGASTKVIGGDWINYGDFCTINIASITDISFQNLNFENYQNLDPTKSPRFLVTVSGVTATVNFIDCRALGGGSLVGKESANIAGLVDVHVIRSSFTGNWNVNVNASSSGITSNFLFEQCGTTPTIVQTLQGAQGYRPANIEYRKHTANGGRVDRVFDGALSGQVNALRGTTVVDNFRFEAILNATSAARSCPVFVPSPYIMQLVGVEIAFTNNTSQTVTIDIWSDSTMTTKLATVTTSAASGQYQNFEISASGILANYQISSTSSPLYVNVTAAANAGTCKMHIGLKLRQVN